MILLICCIAHLIIRHSTIIHGERSCILRTLNKIQRNHICMWLWMLCLWRISFQNKALIISGNARREALMSGVLYTGGWWGCFTEEKWRITTERSTDLTAYRCTNWNTAYTCWQYYWSKWKTTETFTVIYNCIPFIVIFTTRIRRMRWWLYDCRLRWCWCFNRRWIWWFNLRCDRSTLFNICRRKNKKNCFFY